MTGVTVFLENPLLWKGAWKGEEQEKTQGGRGDCEAGLARLTQGKRLHELLHLNSHLSQCHRPTRPGLCTLMVWQFSDTELLTSETNGIVKGNFTSTVTVYLFPDLPNHGTKSLPFNANTWAVHHGLIRIPWIRQIKVS